MERYFRCSICGFSYKNRGNWCALGCGRDYNEMIEIKIPKIIDYRRVECFDCGKIFNANKGHKCKLHCIHNKNKGECQICYPSSRIVLLLDKLNNDWTYWETLIHELNHIVLYLADQKKFADEMECQAYLQEYLFREIRHKIYE